MRSQMATVTLQSLGIDIHQPIELREAVEDLYKVFATYRLKGPVTGCLMTDDEARRLVATSLRSMSADDLSRYAFKAMTTWGTVDEFKHFAPRIVELAMVERALEPEVDVSIVMGKFRYGKLHTWPVEEQRAVCRAAVGFWQSFLIEPLPDEVPYGCTEDWLCAIGQFVDDLSPFLDYWLSLTAPSPVCRLAHLIHDNYKSIQRSGRLRDAFWDERRVQDEQVVAWLLSDDVLHHLEAMYFEHQDAPLSTEISQAVDFLGYARTSRAGRVVGGAE